MSSSARRHRVNIDLTLQAAGERHLRGRDGQAAFAQVVARSHQAGVESPRALPRTFAWRRSGSTVGTCPPARPFTSAKCEPPSSSRRLADEVHAGCPAPSGPSSRTCDTSSIWPSALISSVGGMAIVCRLPAGVDVAEFVVQAVLAADERRAERDRHVVAGHRPRAPASRASPAARVSPQQKLSRIAIRVGSAPTATQLRTASSIALAAMWYGSRSP